MPDKIEKFFGTAGVPLDTMEFNANGMTRLGYDQLVLFSALFEEEWTAYFSERADENEKLFIKYPGNETVLSYVEREKYEAFLFSEHNRSEEDYFYYGYNFYLGRKKLTQETTEKGIFTKKYCRPRAQMVKKRVR